MIFAAITDGMDFANLIYVGTFFVALFVWNFIKAGK